MNGKRIEPPLVLKEIDDPELMYFESADDMLSDRRACSHHTNQVRGTLMSLAFTNIRKDSKMNGCLHLFEIGNVTPRTPNGCEECLKIGDRWLHLRLCLTCGHVGCCDDSKNKHATKHFHSTNHPLIKSFEPGEEWGWCYIDELFFESLPGYANP